MCGVRSCKVGPELSTGDGFQLVCFDANQSALAFGAACSPDPALGMRCADWAKIFSKYTLLFGGGVGGGEAAPTNLFECHAGQALLAQRGIQRGFLGGT